VRNTWGLVILKGEGGRREESESVQRGAEMEVSGTCE